ncbi:SDR family oxidoreductase [Isoalcanivorax beigongshangi]|uniref:SDR family oxidoreductase n=1 Tax=Isoalcanivorax beigongshangi TaxID=3238810 RepID=A0ABV4AIH7_9GAMM
MELDFSQRNVFIAGGSSGINLGIAHAFAARGARVALLSRSAEKLGVAATELARYGGEVLALPADVRDVDSVRAALAEAHRHWGPIDVLVSGAAGNFLAPATGMSENGFRTVIEIDLMGTFHVLRNAYGFLRKPGASVINISASQAFNPTLFQAHVCAAKAGVDMLTQVLAMEWGPEGIRVNSIVPGPIADTEGMRRLAPEPEALAAVVDQVPLRRLGTVEDVGHMALVLSSPLASYVTGTVVKVDGGNALRGSRDYREAVQSPVSLAKES